jgi:integrase
VVERARRALGVEPPRTRRRTVQRLDYPEVERLIRSAYRDSSAYGVMIKTLFLTGARVNEFVHIRVEDLHLDDESPRIYLTYAKREASRYVPVLPALAQELRFEFDCRLLLHHTRNRPGHKISLTVSSSRFTSCIQISENVGARGIQAFPKTK